MILGNPLALGGGNLLPTDAILRVQAPAGSTVTITKGTTTKTDEGHENADDNTVYDYYFIIHASQFDSVNAWTVTATDGASTATGTVTIDTADEYDLILNYLFYIQKSGEGLQVEMGWKASGGNVTVTFGANAIVVAPSGSSGNTAYVGTKAKVNLTNYSQLVIVCPSGTGEQGVIGFYSVIYSSGSYSENWGTPVASGTLKNGTITIDISNVSGEYYLNFETFAARTISDIYLAP